MANRFLRSTDGSDADNGTTWELAKATLAGIPAVDSAGDTVFVSASHAESTAGNVAYTSAGTIAASMRILCVDDTGDPASPTTLATTAEIATTGASSIGIGGYTYWYGIKFTAGDSTNSTNINFGVSKSDIFERCVFYHRGTGSTGRITITGGTNALPEILWKNCDVQLSHASQYISLTQAKFVWEGGSFLMGTSPTFILGNTGSSRGASALISGVDFSALDAGVHLVGLNGGWTSCIFRNCKLPASWSGSIATGTKIYGCRIELYNCDSGDTNYRIWIDDYTGSVKNETGVYKDTGTTDGTTALSYRFTPTANTNYMSGRFFGPEFVAWNDTTGSNITATVYLIHGHSALLQDDEIFLECMYQGPTDGGTGVYDESTWTSDAVADVLATPANQDTDTAAWSGTAARANNTVYVANDIIDVQGALFVCTVGGTSNSTEPAGYATAADGDTVTDNTATFRKMYRQKLAVTLTTPRQKGAVIGRVVLGAVPSSTLPIFVDPALYLS